MARGFRELLERFESPGRMSTVVLVGSTVELPAEVQPHAVRYALKLPTRDGVHAHDRGRRRESLRLAGRARIEIAAADYAQLAQARERPHAQPGPPGRRPRGDRRTAGSLRRPRA